MTNGHLDIIGRAVKLVDKLVIDKGEEVASVAVLRDPEGTNLSPYTIPNPSLLQVGINQPLNQPVLDHVDLISGLVTGYISPDSPLYAGAAPGGVGGAQDDAHHLVLMVVQHPDEGDDVRSRRQRVGEETAADRLGAVGQAEGGEAGLGAGSHRRQVEQHQLEARSAGRRSRQEAALPAAHVQQGAVAVQRVGREDLFSYQWLRGAHQRRIRAGPLRTHLPGGSRVGISPEARQLAAAGLRLAAMSSAAPSAMKPWNEKGRQARAQAHQALLKTRGLQFDFGNAPQDTPPDWLKPLQEFLEVFAPVLQYVFWGGLIV
eukprot:gene32441-43340_t